MNEKKFSIVESLRFSFFTLINNIVFFLSMQTIVVAILIAACLIAGGMIYLLWPTEATIYFTSMLENNAATGNEIIRTMLEKSYVAIPMIIACTLFIGILYCYFVLGIIRISLDFYDHKTSSLGRLFGPFALALKAFIAAILYHVMVGIGCLLFIIPGIIAAIRFSMYQQILVDKNVGIIDSLKMSAQITKGSVLNILGLNLIFMLINISSYLTFGLTYIITLPIFYLAYAYTYRKLLATPGIRQENN